MNVMSIRKEIRELKNSIIWKQKPVCKAFIMGAKDGPTKAEIEAYRKDHPHIKVIVLTRKECGSGCSE